MYSEKFEDIRPYRDSEINSAMYRISRDPNFERVITSFFPDHTASEIRKIITGIFTIYDFQKRVMLPILHAIMNKSVKEYSFSGLQNVNKLSKHLYISNHRDIVLDALFLQKTLFENEIDTTEVTFGSNLMSSDFIVDVGKSNKMFKVIRSASPKDFLRNSRLLSNYIRYTLMAQKHSVWIAQRNGRTKDGVDKTDQGLIKMLSISGNKDFIQNFTELNITPVSISYEYESCDYLKVRETCLSKSNTYLKSKNEDLHSIITGVTQNKGNVHLAICDPISIEEIENLSKFKHNQKYDAMAKLIDTRIIDNYRLWKTNYIAFDTLSKSNQFRKHYSENEKSDFIEYMKEQLSKITDIDDFESLQQLFLELYANPVICYLKLISGKQQAYSIEFDLK
jgi:hypothetical protein